MNEAATSPPRWLGLISIFTVLAIWEAACRMEAIPPALLPSVSTIASRFFVFLTDPYLLTQLGTTLQRLAAGLTLAIVIGVVVGIMASMYRPTSKILEIVIGILAPLPKIALYPALLLTLGFDHAPKIALVAIDALFPILIATFQAVRLMDSKLLWSASSMGTTRLSSVYKIVLPACLPAVLTGIRIGAVIACIVVLLAEMLASTNGLGHVLVSASRSFRSADMFVPIIIMSLIGFSLDKGLAFLARKSAHR
ncbi:ABC transporter permease [Pusillimonas sp.]|uniref:ABC transporter permease n=1 Tax=Pusillimonas sp. TaxID=3040095 RepID=UPI0037C60841